jgi:hypothetical protein
MVAIAQRVLYVMIEVHRLTYLAFSRLFPLLRPFRRHVHLDHQSDCGPTPRSIAACMCGRVVTGTACDPLRTARLLVEPRQHLRPALSPGAQPANSDVRASGAEPPAEHCRTYSVPGISATARCLGISKECCRDANSKDYQIFSWRSLQKLSPSIRLSAGRIGKLDCALMQMEWRGKYGPRFGHPAYCGRHCHECYHAAAEGARVTAGSDAPYAKCRRPLV